MVAIEAEDITIEDTIDPEGRAVTDSGLIMSTDMKGALVTSR